MSLDPKIGVHASHCCRWHGCKYGDEDCPVETGQVAQDYPCMDCHHDPHEVAQLEFIEAVIAISDWHARDEDVYADEAIIEIREQVLKYKAIRG